MAMSSPADAVNLSDWIDDGDRFRLFDGSSWQVPMIGDVERFNVVTRMTPDISVKIHGVQFADGGVHRWVAVKDVPAEMPAETALQLSEALSAAYAEIESYR